MLIVALLIVAGVFLLLLVAGAFSSGSSGSSGGQGGRLAADRNGSQFWRPPGSMDTVAGITFESGLLYIGTGLKAAIGHEPEPALIDPRLDASTVTIDRKGRYLAKGRSYALITASARHAYLEWIATGRSDRSFSEGYVLLYLAGLERRALFDATRSPESRVVLPSIAAELTRLRTHYADVPSVATAAERLHVAMAASFPQSAPGPDPRPAADGRVPLWLRFAIGKALLDGRPVAPGHVVDWVRCADSGLRLPFAPSRAADPFRHELIRTLEEHFPAGFAPAVDITQLPRLPSIAYRPVSPGLGAVVDIELSGAPDIDGRPDLIDPIRPLVDDVCRRLTDRADLIARSTPPPVPVPVVPQLPAPAFPAAGASHSSLRSGTPGAGLRSGPASTTPAGPTRVRPAPLPPERPSLIPQALLKLDTLLNGSSMTVVTPGKLYSALQLRVPAGGAPDMVEYYHALGIIEAAGYGVEPDPRYGGPATTRKPVVFRFPGGAPTLPHRYADALPVMELAAMVALADGEIEDAEWAHLDAVGKIAGLTEIGMRRFRARVLWSDAMKMDKSHLAGRFAQMTQDERSAAAETIVAIAGTGGRITSLTIDTLRKAFALLGLPEEELYSAIAAMRAAGTASVPIPPTLQPSGPRQPSTEPVPLGRALPGPSGPTPTRGGARPASGAPIALNMDLVRQKIEHSALAVSVLGDPVDEPEAIAVVATGMDERHRSLLTELGAQTTWTRDGYQDVARRYDLMPDVARDRINEAAYEKAGYPVLDGDDIIMVDHELLKELIA